MYYIFIILKVWFLISIIIIIASKKILLQLFDPKRGQNIFGTT